MRRQPMITGVTAVASLFDVADTSVTDQGMFVVPADLVILESAASAGKEGKTRE